jgi:hypothetical protein
MDSGFGTLALPMQGGGEGLAEGRHAKKHNHGGQAKSAIRENGDPGKKKHYRRGHGEKPESAKKRRCGD